MPLTRPALLLSLTLTAFAAPPTLRLPDDVVPLNYAVDLTLAPSPDTFSGRIEIDVEIRRPTQLIWLNATELSVSEAMVEANGSRQVARIEPGGTDFIGCRLPRSLRAGAAKLRLTYRGKISHKNSAGVFLVHEGQQDYLYTQFEATDARRAFPCFDEPGFKTPWRVTLHVRSEHTAISNTPRVSEGGEPGGMKRVVFSPTKPLPSYLVAFAVGPFDVVDGGKAGANQVPVRIVTPRGKAAQARYAAAVTATLVDRLEAYFGVPYPFEKIDSVAIPLTFGFGAMENAGLITYGQTLILSDPALDSDLRQRTYASVAAHELAHQWFGNLVTLEWWDDTWLNEAFATWTASKIIAGWKPEWNSRVDDLGPKFDAMANDSLVSARRIRQPVESKDDISNAFDSITYEKGAAVIRMFESWVGESTFRSGVTSYLKRYAFRNARVGDFLDSIAGAGQPRLTGAFSTFLERPGLPRVSVKLECEDSPRIALSQDRQLPIGSAGSAKQAWDLPVCVSYPSGGTVAKECFLLDKPSAEFKLTRASSCPAYILANSAASGYYVTRYQPELLRSLLRAGSTSLASVERATLLHDLDSLADAGQATVAELLDAAMAFAGDPERQVAGQAKNIVAGIRRFVPDRLRPRYAAFVTRAFGERARRLGWSATPGADRETRLERAVLVPWVAREGADPGLAEEARRLADGWLKDRGGVDPDMLNGILTTAAYFGGRDFFDRLLAEWKKLNDLQLQQSVIAALGASRDPKIARRALDLILHSDIDPRQSIRLLRGPLENSETERVPFEFVQANYRELIERLPNGGSFEAGAALPSVGLGLCDEPSRKAFVTLFEERSKKFLGGSRNFSQALETIRLCEARKAVQAGDVAAYFSKP